MATHDESTMSIAIVGIGGRFPGEATNPDRLWDMVSNGRSALAEVPKDRFNIDAFYHPHAERQGTMNVRAGYFLKDDVALFDAPFFSITAKEAQAMDPQQRLALEIAYEALENSGMRLEDVLGSPIACYMASFTRDYAALRGHDADDLPTYEATGNGLAMISNRISWFFDLKGPSITFDTACSSSLVALHLACQSIRAGETKCAMVGGTNLILMPELQTAMASLHFLSPDGKSQAFDHKANGYARGEGAAVIVIKPLADAIKDGNTIRAIIRATGVNQDGKTPGITLPSAQAQEDLIRSTYAAAGLPFDQTGYFEAHGTGTPSGDPLECAAIGATLGVSRPKESPLLVGSVKTNIGHMEGVSGLAGLIKAVYALERGLIPPNLWFEKANPRIPLAKWGLDIPTQLQPWPTTGLRRASINSFGYGGTNAHCVLDDAYHYMKHRALEGSHHTVALPGNVDGKEGTASYQLSAKANTGFIGNKNELSITGSERGDEEPTLLSLSPHPKLLIWTSHEQTGIDRTATELRSYLSHHKNPDSSLLTNLCHTFITGRSQLPWKAYTIASTVEELSSSLMGDHRPRPVRSAQHPTLCFVFTGQGAQWFAMGRELRVYNTFRLSMEEASKYMKELGSEWDLVDELSAPKEWSRVNESAISQPACTALQVALVDLLREWNVTPSVVVGHSSGEIAAAYAKGAISRCQAWKIAYHRGRLSSNLSQEGAMLAVGLGENEVLPFISQVPQSSGDIVVACINSPSSVTLSGDGAAISSIETILQEKNIFNRRLAVKTAYHSPHMEALESDYLQALADIHPQTVCRHPEITMVSSVTGDIVDDATLAGAQYWIANLVSTVRFNRAIQKAFGMNFGKGRTSRKTQYVNLLVEVGPHAALQAPLKQILNVSRESLKHDMLSTSTLVRNVDAVRSCLDAVGKLAQRNYPVDISRLNNDGSTSGRKPCFLTDLPPFSWNHSTRYWYESALSAAFRRRKLPRFDLLGALSEHSSDAEPCWKNYLRMSEVPWIEHHKVQGTILYPLSGMLVMAIEAARQVADQTKEIEGFQIRDVAVGKAMVLATDMATETRIQFRSRRAGTRLPDSSWNEFTVSSRSRAGVWTHHCTGLITVRYVTEHNHTFHDEESSLSAHYHDGYNKLHNAGLQPNEPRQFYASSAELGLQWGPSFRGLVRINLGDYEAHCELEVPDTRGLMPEVFEYPHVIHPATLDNFIQMVLLASTPNGVQLDKAMVPKSVESLYVSNKISSTPGTTYYGYSKSRPYGFNESIGNVVASDETWKRPLVIIEGCRIVSLDNATDGFSLESTATNSSLRKMASRPEWVLNIDYPPVNKAQRSLSPSGENNPPPMHCGDVTIIVPVNTYASISALATKLTAILSPQVSNVKVLTLYEAATVDLGNTTSVTLLEADTPWLQTVDAKSFEELRHIFRTSKRTLWITRGGAMDSPHPDSNLIAGLGRTIRAEIPDVHLTTLDLDPLVSIEGDETVTSVARILDSIVQNGSVDYPDWEYAVRGGHIHSLRLMPDKRLNPMFEPKRLDRPSEILSFHQPGRALALAIKTPGMLDTFQFIDDKEYMKRLASDEVEVEVKAVGMNFHDVMISMGQITDTGLGVECSGIVTRVGDAVTKYRPGDRVMTFRLGCFRTYLRNPEIMFEPVPDSLSLEDAASIFGVYTTAYYSLYYVARLSRDETVLIHGAAGGLGQASIILAQHIGAEIFVTVSSNAKKQFLIETYGILEDHIFNSRDHNFAAGVKRMTNQRGVDVVLNSLAGEALRQTWLCVAPFGRFIELGKRDIVGNTGLDMSHFMHNTTFAGVNMLAVYRDNIPLFRRIITDVMKALEDGIIRPVQPLRVMDYSSIEEAFRIMQSGKHIGKLVLKPSPDSLVPIVPPRMDFYSFSRPATYLIPGGLGGLGRSITSWMADQGAKHLVFTSRSGGSKPEAKMHLEHLQARGVKALAFASDISDPDRLRDVLASIDASHFPPIKGVINCAMQLQDVLYENMTVEDFHAAIRPKVFTTKNLHELCPKDMDFFVCLSSTGGIVGSRGQANYNAGNTYQDAIAHCRRSQGYPATSINLGPVEGIGCIAERDDILSYFKSSAILPINEKDVLKAVQAAISGHMPAQAVIGLDTGGYLKKHGHTEPFWFSEARFGPLREYETDEFQALPEGSSADSAADLESALRRAVTIAEATDAVCTALVRKLAKALMMELEDLDPNRPANTYGVDSLVAVEVRAWVFKEVKSDVSVFDILSNMPLASLAGTIAAKSTLLSPAMKSADNYT
ncbi:putative polyketide synthase [Aspergillus avenaceus]|uniref:Putative polyketide synthase n=1 Tax=Aspergillus avenaceus TaxID=36643 RepID=A0A5N6TWS5_ASPAV|nr:putative polyketide synthase [Aspergillus avenaceus]